MVLAYLVELPKYRASLVFRNIFTDYQWVWCRNLNKAMLISAKKHCLPHVILRHSKEKYIYFEGILQYNSFYRKWKVRRYFPYNNSELLKLKSYAKLPSIGASLALSVHWLEKILLSITPEGRKGGREEPCEFPLEHPLGKSLYVLLLQDTIWITLHYLFSKYNHTHKKPII